jgi:eukaryotic-like serine/threonine-protein kinase
MARRSTDAHLSDVLYVAPELLAGSRASAQSDVYALGILLYQLLIGDFNRAIAPGWRRDIYDPLLTEDIAHTTDQDPSQRMATAEQLHQQLLTLETRRQAIEQQRRQAEGLAASQAALARNRARRPWLILAGVILASIALLSFVQYRAAEAQRRTAEQARTLAEQARVAAEDARAASERFADSASAVQQFLAQDILLLTDPTDPRFDPKADRKQILKNAAKAIEERFPNDPLARAALHLEIGGVFKALTLRAETREHLGKSVELFSQALGADHEQTLSASYNLAHAESLESRFKEAEQRQGETDRLAGAKLHQSTALALYAALVRAKIATAQYQPERAVPSYRRALDLAAKGAPIDANDLETAQLGLADGLTRLNKLDEALQVLKQMEARELG